MPKSLSLGNGNLLVQLDKFAQVGDFYFPMVGMENQIGRAQVHKIGVWADNRFSWLDDGSWKIAIDYRPQTLAGDIIAKNEVLGLQLEFLDAVYNEKDIFLRKVTVQSLNGVNRQIKIFFDQQFDIAGSNVGNTAYFEPVTQTVIHYKGRRIVIIGGKYNDKSFDDYCIGLHNIEGKEGTFKDAEDGSLSKNPVEHGCVDSVVGFTLDLKGSKSETFYYWICAAREYKEALALHYYVLERSPEHLLSTTESFWKAWVNKYDFCFDALPDSVSDLFKKSLLIMRTHADNRGAIIASGDSDILQYGRDTYGYMWPRDGAYGALALARAGYFDVSERFLNFCLGVLSEEGYLLQKYVSDKSLGSSWLPWVRDGRRELAIQEDETGICVFALWEHYRLTKDLEFVESIYNFFIKKAADFMVNYRDEKSKLPLPSYDLWEQYFCVSTYTAAVVYGGLKAAANFAELLEKKDDQSRYINVAGEIKEAILQQLYNKENGSFYKKLDLKDEKLVADPTIDISAPAGLFRFDVLGKDDPKMVQAFKVAQEKLTCHTPVGGIARFEGDIYNQVSNETPGNPWIITTLWLAQYQIARAADQKELNKIVNSLNWVVGLASSAGILSEQVDPYSGRQLSVAPLTWSHAEYVLTIIAYLNKLEELGAGKACNPVK